MPKIKSHRSERSQWRLMIRGKALLKLLHVAHKPGLSVRVLQLYIQSLLTHRVINIEPLRS